MPTRKLDEREGDGRQKKEICFHREHEVPSMQVFSPGLWEHVCPGCGHRREFRVGVVWAGGASVGGRMNK